MGKNIRYESQKNRLLQKFFYEFKIAKISSIDEHKYKYYLLCIVLSYIYSWKI